MEDKIRAILQEYKTKDLLPDILWVRNAIQHIGMQRFDEILVEEWRNK